MGNEDKKGKRKDEFKEDQMQSLMVSFNKQGKKKKMELTDQDRWETMPELAENVKYFAVYDGHGAKGKEAAEGLKREVSKRLIADKKRLSKMKDINKVENYFRDLFRSIQKKMSNQNDYELSGSCAVCVLVVDNKMFCINVGDSRCVLGQKKSSDGKKDVEKTAIEMSIDHKPTRDDESKRIIEKGGEVSEKIPGAPRVFRKNDDVPGLAVARSIGDIVAHEVGVSCDPEVFEKELDADDHFIVIGSDGVWDVLSSCETVGFIFSIMETTDKKFAAQKLVEECRNRWEILNLFKQRFVSECNNKNQDNEGGKDRGGNQNVADIDDITAVILFVNMEKEYD